MAIPPSPLISNSTFLPNFLERYFTSCGKVPVRVESGRDASPSMSVCSASVARSMPSTIARNSFGPSPPDENISDKAAASARVAAVRLMSRYSLPALTVTVSALAQDSTAPMRPPYSTGTSGGSPRESGRLSTEPDGSGRVSLWLPASRGEAECEFDSTAEGETERSFAVTVTGGISFTSSVSSGVSSRVVAATGARDAGGSSRGGGSGTPMGSAGAGNSGTATAGTISWRVAAARARSSVPACGSSRAAISSSTQRAASAPPREGVASMVPSAIPPQISSIIKPTRPMPS